MIVWSKQKDCPKEKEQESHQKNSEGSVGFDGRGAQSLSARVVVVVVAIAVRYHCVMVNNAITAPGTRNHASAKRWAALSLLGLIRGFVTAGRAWGVESRYRGSARHGVDARAHRIRLACDGGAVCFHRRVAEALVVDDRTERLAKRAGDVGRIHAVLTDDLLTPRTPRAEINKWKQRRCCWKRSGA